MANLHNKHFGNKVFLSDMNKKIVAEMLTVPKHDDTNKIPNFGILVRYEDGTVGISVQYITQEGYENYTQEPSQHLTISSWAKFHQP